MSGFLTKKIITPSARLESDPAPDLICGGVFAACYSEIVFADAEATGDFWKADKSDFLFLKAAASDTVEFKILKNCSVIATITDNTYGNYYDSFALNAYLCGYVCDWTSVFNAFGGGKYQIQISVNSLGVNYTYTSRIFHVYAFNTQIAYGTVRIESYQTGNIVGMNINYSDVLGNLPDGWYSSIRIKGAFGEKTPTLETDEYFSNTYRLTQNQNKIVNQYTLQTDFLKYEVANKLFQKDILANDMYITSYDPAKELLRRVNLVPLSFQDVLHSENKGAKFVVTFADRIQNQIKRNF